MGFKLTELVVIGTDYIGSCKSNYHTITASVIYIVLVVGMTECVDRSVTQVFDYKKKAITI